VAEICDSCGAPRTGSSACRYCGLTVGGDVLARGFLDASLPGWTRQADLRLAVEGGVLRIEAPATPNELVALRTEGRTADVEVSLRVRFVRGVVFEPGRVGVGFGLELRSTGEAAYDVGLAPSGVFSVSRWDGKKLAAWLAEPKCHSAIVEGLNAWNRVVVRMIGDKLRVRINDVLALSLNDASIALGTVGLSLRPGSEDAAIELADVVVAVP
jgi:hypothetical protein